MDISRITIVYAVMGENSPEHKTLIAHTSDLRLAVKSDIIHLSGVLLSKGLISCDSDAELRNTVCSKEERSAMLVELIQNKVVQNPRHYHTFVSILHGKHDYYEDILTTIEQTFLVKGRLTP